MSLKLENKDWSFCRSGAAAPESHLVGHAAPCVYACQLSIMFQLSIMPQVEISTCVGQICAWIVQSEDPMGRADLQELGGEYIESSTCRIYCFHCFS